MTGDFISFSHFNPMEIQIAAGFLATERLYLALGFWPSVGEAVCGGIFLRFLSMGPFADRSKIDDVSHATSEFSMDANLSAAACPFCQQRHDVIGNCDDKSALKSGWRLYCNRGKTRFVEVAATNRPGIPSLFFHE